MITIFESSKFYFFRKPNGIPSTFGREKSFLEYTFVDPKGLDYFNTFHDLDPEISKYIKKQIKELNIIQINNQDKIDEIIQHIKNNFEENNEFGLLNRLDNETQGLLYFAKSFEIYNNYKQEQVENNFTKFYIAQVYGNPFYQSDEKKLSIDYPIMHHKFSEDRMIVLLSDSDQNKGKGKIHNVSTNIELLNYNPKSNISTLLISINKGIRHQIRVHLNSIGCPIIGEFIYSNKKEDTYLHLRSVGFNGE